jgi:hydroxymethylpyrimidine/phosphomethylpyrimidine kinase
LLDAAGVGVVRERLLGVAGWVTPNSEELGVLTGMEVQGAGDVPAAARRLQAMAREVGNAGLRVVVTGGHLGKPDDYLLDLDGREEWFPGVRVETRATHGTGCAFSSALLAGVVLHGDRLPVQQVRAAKEYVRRAMETAPGMGGGKGPLNLRASQQVS